MISEKNLFKVPLHTHYHPQTQTYRQNSQLSVLSPLCFSGSQCPPFLESDPNYKTYSPLALPQPMSPRQSPQKTYQLLLYLAKSQFSPYPPGMGTAATLSHPAKLIKKPGKKSGQTCLWMLAPLLPWKINKLCPAC